MLIQRKEKYSRVFLRMLQYSFFPCLALLLILISPLPSWAIANFTGSVVINSSDIYTNSRTVTLSLTADVIRPRYVVTIEYSNDGGQSWSRQDSWPAPDVNGYQPITTSTTYTIPEGDGTKMVTVRYTDDKGNQITCFDSIVVDVTAPLTSAYPLGGLYNSSQNVALAAQETGSGPATIYYTTDGSQPTTASSVYGGPIAINTTTTLKFFAKDLAGNVEVVRSETYTIDTTAPSGSVVINAGSLSTNLAEVSLSLASADAAEMQLSNDGIVWTPPEPFAATKLWNLLAEDGPKTVYVQFKDNAGNWSVSYSDSILLDTTAPVTVASPSAGTYNSTQTIILIANENGAAIYFTDDGSEPTTSSPVFSGLITINATATLKFFAKDAAGNMEPVKTETYVIDSQAPAGSVVINAGAPATNSTLVALSLSSPDAQQMQFSEDGENWSPLEPFATSREWTFPTGDGIKTILVRLKDLAGNLSAPYSDSILLDSVAPVTVAAPSGGLYNSVQRVTLVTNESDTTIYFTTDGSEPTSSSMAYSAPITIDEATTLRFFGKDAAGNEEVAKVESYIIDADPPTGSVTINGNAAATNANQVDLLLTSPDAVEMQISNDNAIWSVPEAFSSKRTWDIVPGDGSKTVYVRYKDDAGNWSLSFSDSIMLDTVPPVTAAVPAGGLYNSAQAVTLSVNEGGSEIYYTTDGTPPSTSSSVYGGALTIAASTTLRFFAVDAAGNEEALQSIEYTIDTTPPMGTVVIGEGADYTRTATVTLSIASADALQMQFSNDGISWSPLEPFANGKIWSIASGDGAKTVFVRFKDSAGNLSIAYSDSIILDTTSPVTKASPAGGLFSSTQTVALQANESTAIIYFTTDSTTPTTASAVYSSPLPINAETILRFFAVDGAGNQEEAKSEQYLFDREPPTGTIIINNGADYANSHTVNLTLSSPDGVEMQFSNDNVDWTSPEPLAATEAWGLTAGDGTRTIYVRFKDVAGNWSLPYSDSIILDTVRPTTTAVPPGGMYNSSQIVTLSSNESGAIIYFTSDGSEPSTNSAVYGGGIPIGQTTTVKFFSKDAAGNEEYGKTQKYIINTAPTINGAPAGAILQGRLYSFTPTAADADGDTLTFHIANKPMWASFDTTTGTLSGTPSNSQVGIYAAISIWVSDGREGEASLSPFDLVVVNVNDSPVATSALITTSEDIGSPAVSPSVTDPDTIDSHTFTIESQPGHGTATILNNKLVYRPDANYNGNDEFLFRASDSGGLWVVGTATVTVTPVNDPPVASASLFTTNEDAELVGILNGNDPVEGGPVTFSIAGNGSKGTAVITDPATGEFTYTPGANYNGTDLFTFKVNDGALESGIAAVSVTVNPVNDPPLATSADIAVVEDTVGAAVLPAVIEIDSGDSHTFVIETQPANGTAAVISNRLVYTPLANFNGSDSFSFRATDSGGLSAIGTAAVTVTAVNDVPVAADGTVITTEDADVSGLMTGSDPVEGSSVTFSIVRNGMKGRAVITDSATGAFIYIPDPDYAGNDSFTFKVNDGSADSGIATVVVNITAVNDAPLATSAAMTTFEDTVVSVTPTVMDVDGGDSHTFTLLTQPSGGTAGISANKLVYTPAANFNGSDTFTYTATDTSGLSVAGTASVTITAVNDPPVAVGGAISTDEDTAISGALSGNDAVEGGPVTFSILSSGKKGVATITDPLSGAFIYAPEENAFGADSFTFRVNDGSADSAIAVVNVSITAVNDAPSAASAAITTAEDTALTVTPSVIDADPGDSYVFTVESQPASGSVGIVGNRLHYVPAANFNGSDTFTFRATDSGGLSIVGTAQVNVTPVNDPPVSGGSVFATIEDTAVSGTLIGADPVEGSGVIFGIASNGNHGAAVINDPATGAFTYTPAPNFAGTDSFSFRVSDGSSYSGIAVTSITIASINDAAPEIGGIPALTVKQGEDYSFSPTATDADGNGLSFSIVNKPTWAYFNSTTGALSGVPGNSHVGTTSDIVITVTDGDGASTSLPLFSLMVENVNDPPAISGNPARLVTANARYNFQPYARDVDGDSLTFGIVNKPAWAGFDAATGVLTGIPSIESTGTTGGIMITVADGNGGNAILGPFDITVTGLPSISPGTVVSISPIPQIDLIFSSVTVDGEVGVTTAPTPFAVPGYLPLPGTDYDISTTALYTGDISISIRYNEKELNDLIYEGKLKLFHYQNGYWEDITTSVDSAENRISGISTSLSPFVVAAPVQAVIKVPIMNGWWLFPAIGSGIFLIRGRRK